MKDYARAPVSERALLADAHILCASVYEPAHSLDRLPHKLFGDISHIPSRIVSVAFDLDPSYMLHSNQ